MFDFDTVQNRRDVNACKYIGVDDNITAMSVADMDFVVPEFIKNALYKRIDSVNYKYSQRTSFKHSRRAEYHAVQHVCCNRTRRQGRCDPTASYSIYAVQK